MTSSGSTPNFRLMNSRRWLLLPVLLAFSADAQVVQTKTSDAALEKIANDYIEGYLAWRPGEATALGVHKHDGKITEFSRLSLDAELSRLKRFDEMLLKIDRKGLSARGAIDLRILQAAIRTQLFNFQDMQAFERNPMTYAGAIDLNIYIKRNFAPLEDRVRSIIAIEQQAPNVVTAAKTNLQEKLPIPYVELAIEIARGSASFLQKDLADALKDFQHPQLRPDFEKANRGAVAALQDYANWLEKDRLPKAVPEFAIGPEKYQRMLAQSELIDLPPDKLLEAGVNELKHQQQVFADAAKIVDSAKPPVEVFKEIQKDHPTAESLIPDVAKDLEQIRSFLVDRKLISFPSDVRAKVAETPPYLRATSFASMDTPGPFETKATEAYYYVTPVEKDWPEQQKQEWLTSFNYYTTDVVSIHEAYPGHYVQFLHLNASKANNIEKIFGSYAFIEGWAHYAEQMTLDEGFGAPASPTPTAEEKIRAAKYRMAQADEALLRLCRLCVSIGMHTHGMSVDEGTKFFRENCYYEEKPSRSEAMRGTYDPGYLNYTLGKLEILKLREDYKAQEGANFSLQRFHDEMLKHGMPPIRLLREIMLRDQAKWPEVL
jgi:uncharacterized protein (DUF885 family)